MPWVYVLSNCSFEGLFKIGHTSKASVEERARELFTSGLPTPFEVEGKYQVYDPEPIERMVHEILSALRPQANREFFAATLNEIDEAIRTAIDENEDQLGPKSMPVVTEIDRVAKKKALEQKQRIRTQRLTESVDERRDRWREMMRDVDMRAAEKRRYRKE